MAAWAETSAPSPWDLFVRATDGVDTVDSPLISDPSETSLIVDLVLGEGTYEGRSEWERVATKLGEWLDSIDPAAVPAERLEWLARRADVFPTHAAAYVQAHRLAEHRTIRPRSCYAFLRAGLSANLLELLRAGAGAWESALRDAWARQILPLPGDGSPSARDAEVAAELAAMRELLVDAAVAEPTAGVNQRLLFDTGGFSEAEQRQFADLWVNRTGDLDDFWTAVGLSSLLGSKVADLKFTVEAAIVAGTHVGTLTALQAASVSTMAETAAWSVDDWDDLLVAQSVTPPDTITGANPTEKRQKYARTLANIVEDIHPTLALRHAIDRDAGVSPTSNTEHLVTFLTNNGEFDVTRSTIGTYLAGATDPWDGIDPGDRAAARRNLEIVQRVHRITPRIGRYATSKVLLDNGIVSATQVVASTREEFVARFGVLFSAADHHPDELAGAVWDNAAKVHAKVIGLASQLALAKTQADFVPVPMPGSEQFDEAPGGLAELSEILGNLDYCACTHCRSVFSPAAYLADLLAFLAARPATLSSDALAALHARRPDLRHILLDCANTNTVLPTLDLVNELLEAYVAGDGSLPASSKQTTWTAAELRLHPEHLDPTVYASGSLTTKVHPWTLPFSLPTVEARTYLAHLGVPRHELMRTLAHAIPSEAFEDALAGELLGLDAQGFAIVAGTFTGNASTDDREFWGFGPADDDWVSILIGTHETKGDVGQLLARARIDLDELQALLDHDFLDPDGDIQLRWDESCKLTDAWIEFEDSPQALACVQKLHRFLRLQRASKIPARMLNVLLHDSLGGTLDRSKLLALAEIVRVQGRLGLAWDELATFWADVIDARPYADAPRSLYDRRFRPKDADHLQDFDPAGDGTQLFGESPATAITGAHLPRILAGLGIADADFQRLVDSSLASSAFTFANLSALLRSVLFARALRLSIGDLARLAGSEGLTGEDPFLSPLHTNYFIDYVALIRESGLSVAELDWLLRHEGDSPLDDAATGRVLADLARGLATIDAEAAQLVDPEGTALPINLAEVLASPHDATAIAIVEKTSGLPEVDQDVFIDGHLAGILDAAQAKAVLVDGESASYLVSVAERRAWLLGKVVGHLRRCAMVVDTVAGALGLPSTVAAALLELLTDPASSAPLLDVYRNPFATEAQIALGLSPDTHANEFAAWTRLAKAGLICRRHQLRADEVVWYLERDTWLDLDTLPLDASDPDASFTAWVGLARALSLRDLFRPGELAHADIAAAASFAEGIAIFADHTGWDAAALQSVAEDIGYSLPEQLDNETGLLRLRRIGELGQRLGVGLDVLFEWANDAPSAAQADAIQSTTRAKYGEDRWPDVAAPLRDEIRERQRDALVDAAIAITPAFSSADDVFEHLLIDVEMGACMLTSRIKQAITSVQIFVHRIMLHLEVADVKFGREAIERWEWMKNYRVWEANRKVFLYPENWIEPGLRTNKTPEFEVLEADLVQGVLDAPRVEKALGAYLEKLARVSNLEIMGVFGAATPRAELWLLGRTQAEPHAWYLRTRRTTGAWTAWEEVPHAIDSDVVALVVRERRVHLYWLMWHDSAPNDQELALRYQVGHIERGADGWTDVQLSESSTDRPKPGLDNYRLQCWALEGETRIVVMQSWAGSDVRLNVAFSHILHNRHLKYLGSSFESGAYVSDYSGTPILATPSLVAKQADYTIDGSRYVKVRYNDDGGFDHPIDSDLDEQYGTAPSTDFMQGEFQGTLFQRAPKGGYRALVHQSVMWSPDKANKFRAAVYDDRSHKFLLEPLPVSRKASSDPKALNPGHAEDFHGCPPGSQSSVIRNARPRSAAQRARDELTRTATWGGRVPGQQPTLATLEGMGALQIQSNDAVAVLTQAKDTMGGDVAVAKYDNGFPVDPTDFWLGIELLYHPFARFMLEALTRRGPRGLYAPSPTSPLFRQLGEHDPFDDTELDLAPGIARNRPVEEFDFRFDSPYGIYNWEIFFHVPMLIADKLATEQRWDEAQQWYHLIFNPIELVAGDDEVSKFWRIKPFVEQAGTLAKDQLQAMLGIGVSESEQELAVEAFERQVAAWEDNPFDPHAVARVRPGVYQRTLLRKYFDNLLAWADNLFRRDTIESISEATVLYVLLRQLLGRRPQEVPAPDDGAKTFAELASGGLDAFSNALVELESWVHLPSKPAAKVGCVPAQDAESWVRVPVVSHFWYFCYPPNSELLKYWDILDDRLFKIRHCQNIEGVTRTLPLFEPPIDPALLVQAAAAGIDIQSVLAELDSGLPPYRFRSVHARASAFTNSLKSLAGALLSALEKQDAEQLARLRSEHEIDMLGRVRDIRKKQVSEAQAAIESLERGIEGVVARRGHYERLSNQGLSDLENRAFDLGKKARIGRQGQQSHYAIAGILGAVPQTVISISPEVEFGGQHLASIFNAGAAVFGMVASEFEYHANKASTRASFARRAEDWDFQIDQADHDLARMQKELIAAKIRVELAELELANHDRQAEHTRAIDQYMRSKFTNRELYDWMVGQLSTLYFQTYQLAFDLAKRAERAYRHELAIPTDEPAIIKYGYWDSLRKGLLAGDKLGHDLERLDLAYMDRDIREFELRKAVSLADLDPDQLNALRETGKCTFTIPEVFYDLDHPGHYLRRIRALRLTIPAVVGPYTSLGARIQLESHKTRMTSSTSGGYAEGENDERFRYGTGGGQAIATSTAMADGGLFNLDFRDERYLPFEYAGAISTWSLELPDKLRQFDYRTIEDVIVHVDYTARDGVSRTDVENSLVGRFNEVHGEEEPMALIVSVDAAFPNEWEQFFAVSGGDHVLTLPLSNEHFPYFARRRGFTVAKVGVVLLLAPTLASASFGPIAASLDVQVSPGSLVKTAAAMTATFTAPASTPAETWTLTIADSVVPTELQDESDALDRSKVVGLALVIAYTLNPTP
ncbi:neuraminidase-like domain-containing protein [Nannocystaceae bacterium ST9]